MQMWQGGISENNFSQRYIIFKNITHPFTFFYNLSISNILLLFVKYFIFFKVTSTSNMELELITRTSRHTFHQLSQLGAPCLLLLTEVQGVSYIETEAQTRNTHQIMLFMVFKVFSEGCPQTLLPLWISQKNSLA